MSEKGCTMSEYSVEIGDKFDRLVNKKENCQVVIKRLGAEVISYQVWDENGGKMLPLLWNDNNDSPPPQGGWKNHATVLFPHVGGLKNRESWLGDVKITSPGNHGFARHSVFDVVGHDDGDHAYIRYRLIANNETRRFYPFDFKFDVVYSLRGNELSAEFEITSMEESEDIFFSLGWHPGFSTSYPDIGGKKSDWQIILKRGRYRHYRNNENCRLTGEIDEFDFEGPLSWTEEELERTVMLEIENRDIRTCEFYNPKIKRGLKIDFRDFPFLVIWSEIGREFICIEPCQGLDDHEMQESFDQKVGIVRLSPLESKKWRAVVKPIFR
jgi:galactose mutarotase-like enzyme